MLTQIIYPLILSHFIRILSGCINEETLIFQVSPENKCLENNTGTGEYLFPNFLEALSGVEEYISQLSQKENSSICFPNINIVLLEATNFVTIEQISAVKSRRASQPGVDLLYFALNTIASLNISISSSEDYSSKSLYMNVSDFTIIIPDVFTIKNVRIIDVTKTSNKKLELFHSLFLFNSGDRLSLRVENCEFVLLEVLINDARTKSSGQVFFFIESAASSDVNFSNVSIEINPVSALTKYFYIHKQLTNTVNDANFWQNDLNFSGLKLKMASPQMAYMTKINIFNVSQGSKINFYNASFSWIENKSNITGSIISFEGRGWLKIENSSIVLTISRLDNPQGLLVLMKNESKFKASGVILKITFNASNLKFGSIFFIQGKSFIELTNFVLQEMKTIFRTVLGNFSIFSFGYENDINVKECSFSGIVLATGVNSMIFMLNRLNSFYIQNSLCFNFTENMTLITADDSNKIYFLLCNINLLSSYLKDVYTYDFIIVKQRNSIFFYKLIYNTVLGVRLLSTLSLANNVTVIKSNFTKSEIQYGFATLFNLTAGSRFEAIGSVFVNIKNRAIIVTKNAYYFLSGCGGLLFFQGRSTIIFISNTINDIYAGVGAVLISQDSIGSKIIFYLNNFSKITAELKGGLIHFSNSTSDEMTVLSNNFLNINSNQNGAVVDKVLSSGINVLFFKNFMRELFFLSSGGVGTNIYVFSMYLSDLSVILADNLTLENMQGDRGSKGGLVRMVNSKTLNLYLNVISLRNIAANMGTVFFFDFASNCSLYITKMKIENSTAYTSSSLMELSNNYNITCYYYELILRDGKSNYERGGVKTQLSKFARETLNSFLKRVLAFSENSNVSLLFNNGFLQDLTSYDSGGFFILNGCENCAFAIDKSIFFNISAETLGGVFYLSINFNITASISDSKFINCSSDDGGVMGTFKTRKGVEFNYSVRVDVLFNSCVYHSITANSGEGNLLHHSFQKIYGLESTWTLNLNFTTAIFINFTSSLVESGSKTLKFIVLLEGNIFYDFQRSIHSFKQTDGTFIIRKNTFKFSKVLLNKEIILLSPVNKNMVMHFEGNHYIDSMDAFAYFQEFLFSAGSNNTLTFKEEIFEINKFEFLNFMSISNFERSITITNIDASRIFSRVKLYFFSLFSVSNMNISVSISQLLLRPSKKIEAVFYLCEGVNFSLRNSVIFFTNKKNIVSTIIFFEAFMIYSSNILIENVKLTNKRNFTGDSGQSIFEPALKSLFYISKGLTNFTLAHCSIELAILNLMSIIYFSAPMTANFISNTFTGSRLIGKNSLNSSDLLSNSLLQLGTINKESTVLIHRNTFLLVEGQRGTILSINNMEQPSQFSIIIKENVFKNIKSCILSPFLHVNIFIDGNSFFLPVILYNSFENLRSKSGNNRWSLISFTQKISEPMTENAFRISVLMSNKFKMSEQNIQTAATDVSYMKFFTDTYPFENGLDKPLIKKLLSEEISITDIVNLKYNTNCYFKIIALDDYDQINLSMDELLKESNEALLDFYDDNLLITTHIKFGVLCADKFTLSTYNIPKENISFRIQNGTKGKGFLNFPRLIDMGLVIDFKQCLNGEIFDQNTRLCKGCPEGTYFRGEQIFDLSAECSLCLEIEPFYCLGSQQRSPKPGFWRLNKNSDKFLACPNKFSCRGDILYNEIDQYEYFTGQLWSILSIDPVYEKTINSIDIQGPGYCIKGYKGLLCLECEEGFGMSNKYDCNSCGDLADAIKKIVLLILRISLFWLSIHKAITMNEALGKEITGEIQKKAIGCYLIKILTQHLQVLYLLLSIPLEYPFVISEIFSFAVVSAAPDLKTIFSIECFMKSINIHVPNHYVKLTLIMILNGVTLVLFYLLAFIKKRRFNKNILLSLTRHTVRKGSKLAIMTDSQSGNRASLGVYYKNPLLIVFYIFLIDIVAQVQPFLDNYDCIHLEENNTNSDYSRLLVDISIRCNSANHKIARDYISLPIMLFITAVLPCYIVIQLIVAKINNNLENIHFLNKYGYFYYSYDRKLYFFEIFVYTKKILFVLMQMYFNHVLFGRETAIINPCLVLVTYLGLFYSIFLSVKPYEKVYFSQINRAESLSFLCLLQSVFIVICMLGEDYSYSGKVIRNIFFGAQMSINLLFFLYWMVNYFDNMKKKMNVFYKKFNVIYSKIKQQKFTLVNFKNFAKPKKDENIEEDELTLLKKEYQDLKDSYRTITIKYQNLSETHSEFKIRYESTINLLAKEIKQNRKRYFSCDSPVKNYEVLEEKLINSEPQGSSIRLKKGNDEQLSAGKYDITGGKGEGSGGNKVTNHEYQKIDNRFGFREIKRMLVGSTMSDYVLEISFVIENFTTEKSSLELKSISKDESLSTVFPQHSRKEMITLNDSSSVDIKFWVRFNPLEIIRKPRNLDCLVLNYYFWGKADKILLADLKFSFELNLRDFCRMELTEKCDLWGEKDVHLSVSEKIYKIIIPWVSSKKLFFAYLIENINGNRTIKLPPGSEEGYAGNIIRIIETYFV